MIAHGRRREDGKCVAKEDTPEDFAAALGDLLIDGFELILPFNIPRPGKQNKSASSTKAASYDSGREEKGNGGQHVHLDENVRKAEMSKVSASLENCCKVCKKEFALFVWKNRMMMGDR